MAPPVGFNTGPSLEVLPPALPFTEFGNIPGGDFFVGVGPMGSGSQVAFRYIALTSIDSSVDGAAIFPTIAVFGSPVDLTGAVFFSGPLGSAIAGDGQIAWIALYGPQSICPVSDADLIAMATPGFRPVP
jgi:hypothetical protein